MKNWVIRKIIADFEFLKCYLENDLCPTLSRYKLSSKRLKRLFLQEKISFKIVERKKIIRKMQLIRGDIRTVMNCKEL